jgi:hypothetical protein
MTQDHYIALLRVQRRKRPFQVFTIELVDGERLEIDHVDAVAVIGALTRFISPGGIKVWFDHSAVLRFIEAGSSEDAS